jgi:hypothetical protein
MTEFPGEMGSEKRSEKKMKLPAGWQSATVIESVKLAISFELLSTIFAKKN